MAESEMQYRNIFDSDENGSLLQLSDATIHTEDGCKFDIHRIILAKRNSYFRAMFCGFGKNKRMFLIPGISGKCLSEILIYIYTDEITLSDRNIADLMIAADYLLMSDLMNTIKQYSNNLTLENSLPILLSASKLNVKDMYEACFRFIQIHCDEVILHHRALISDIPLQVLENLLSNRSLYNVSEAILWDVIVDWVQKEELRQAFVPILVQYLAASEIDEDLAKNIINNDIVMKNPHCEDISTYKSNNNFQTDNDIILKFLRCRTNHVKQIEFRIPPKLHVVSKICKRNTNEVMQCFSEIYVSYDEQLNVWRKINDVPFVCPDKILHFRNKVYVYEAYYDSFSIVDLKDNSVTEIETMKFCGFLSAFNIRGLLYFYGVYNRREDLKKITVYNPQTNRWQSDLPSFNGVDEEAASLFNKIYVVARKTKPRRIVAAVYDPENHANSWSDLSPPTIFPFFTHSGLVAYQGQLFLMGEKDGLRGLEIFDPNTGEWKKGPNLPKICDCSSKAVVLNETLYIHGCENQDNSKRYTFRWDDSEESWYKMRVYVDFEICRFCEIDEEDSIKFLWKEKKFSNSELRRLNFT